MRWHDWVIAGLGLLLGGWMTFDGIRAFVRGDYVTPSSGEYAGQLGPWAKVVTAVGLEPRSAAVKAIHVGLGIVWLGAAGCFLFGLSWARWALAGCAIASLWYLPFGTLIGIIQLALIFSLHRP